MNPVNMHIKKDYFTKVDIKGNSITKAGIRNLINGLSYMASELDYMSEAKKDLMYMTLDSDLNLDTKRLIVNFISTFSKVRYFCDLQGMYYEDQNIDKFLNQFCKEEIEKHRNQLYLLLNRLIENLTKEKETKENENTNK